MAEQTSQTQQPKLQRTEDFISRYANNVRFENSVWDLKIIFGDLDQSQGDELIRQHTLITLPWSTVKLLIYYLRANLAIQEKQNGKVKMSFKVWPPLPDLTAVPQDAADYPQFKAAAEIMAKLREEFISDQQEPET
jgi:hypothetical protein